MHSVHTNLSKSDITRAVLARLIRLGALLKAWLLWTLVLAGLIGFVRGLPQEPVEVLVLAISASLAALASVGVSVAFTLLRIRNGLKDGDGVLGEHAYAVTAGGLTEKTVVNETLARWNGIKGVRKTRAFAFIEMRSGSFHIIPRRSFRSPDHEANFLSELQRHATSDS
jgi:YcxB-like protein